jgi:hypothetical protein
MLGIADEKLSRPFWLPSKSRSFHDTEGARSMLDVSSLFIFWLQSTRRSVIEAELLSVFAVEDAWVSCWGCSLALLPPSAWGASVLAVVYISLSSWSLYLDHATPLRLAY